MSNRLRAFNLKEEENLPVHHPSLNAIVDAFIKENISSEQLIEKIFQFCFDELQTIQDKTDNGVISILEKKIRGHR